MLKIKQFTFNLFSENTIVLDNGENGAVIIDPGCYSDDEKNAFLNYLDAENIRPSAIFLTHGHPDHVYGVKMLQSKYDIPVYLHKDDLQVLGYSERLISKLGLKNPDTTFSKTWISDGQKISAAGLEFEVIHTPGHSPGCVCYYDRKDGLNFTGDTLFGGGSPRPRRHHHNRLREDEQPVPRAFQRARRDDWRLRFPANNSIYRMLGEDYVQDGEYYVAFSVVDQRQRLHMHVRIKTVMTEIVIHFKRLGIRNELIGERVRDT